MTLINPMPPEVERKFAEYPAPAREVLLEIRSLVYRIAQLDELGEVLESLKWGEPSYAVKGGSPIRCDWKMKEPEQYCLFFNCNTKLVDAFRERFSDVLQFQGNRAIVLPLSAALPEAVIAECLTMAMKYHKIKHQL